MLCFNQLWLGGDETAPACQLCVGDVAATLRVGETLPVRRVSEPPPVKDPAEPSCGKALVPWMPVDCRLSRSMNACVCR